MSAEPTDEMESEADAPPPPSCLPAVVAATLLMGIVAFVLCAGSTWYLFQQRTVFAIRTLEGYSPVIEQSYLSPEDKVAIIEQLEAVTKKMKVEDFPPAKASAVMERLVRLPLPQWGELQVIAAWTADNFDGEQRDVAQRQIRRLQTAIAKDLATIIDVNHVLEPVTTVDTQSPLGRTLNQPLTRAGVLEVVDRAGLMADRSEIESNPAEPPPIGEILAKQLRAADIEGGY